MDKDELLSNLAQFSGTVAYYRTAHVVLITDGVKYLADNTLCYWSLVRQIATLGQSANDHLRLPIKLLLQMDFPCRAVVVPVVRPVLAAS